MKKIIATLVAFMAAGTLATAGGEITPIYETAEAEPTGLYVGGAYGASVTETTVSDYYSSYSDDIDYDELMVNVGYNINDFVAVEGRYWFGFQQGTYDFDGYYADESIDAWGVYIKPQYPVATGFNIYGLLGYAETTYTLSNYDGFFNPKFDLTVDGFSWGLGASYDVTDNVLVFVDYVNLYDDTTTVYDIYEAIDFEDTIGTFNFGVAYKF